MRGFTIQVEDILTYRLRVLVRDVPFEVKNEWLKDLLENYGEVSKIDYMRRRHKHGKYSRVVTGRRIVWMNLRHAIPSSLFINQTKSYIYILHDGQP